jgi:hypothetical protein
VSVEVEMVAEAELALEAVVKVEDRTDGAVERVRRGWIVG